MHSIAVLSGGLGTRVSHMVTEDLPKAMMQVSGRPFIDYKLAGLASLGFKRVVLLVGFRAAPLVEHVGDGSAFGLDIEIISDEPHLLGTGGSLRAALDKLGPIFWVTYSDSYLTLPVAEAEDAFEVGGFLGMMTVLRNYDRWDNSNVRCADGKVVEYRKGAPKGTFEFIDHGMLLFRSQVLEGPPKVMDMSEILQDLISRSSLGAFEVFEPFHEIGSVEGYKETERFFRESGEIERLLPFLP